MGLLVGWVKQQSLGYLCLDDVVIEKAFAKRLPWAGWTYSFAKKRKVYGLHVVLLLWCSQDRRWRIPVAFRLWRPKRSVGPHAYRTKLELAEAMLKEVVAAGLKCQYLVFDTHYTAGWFAKLAGRLGLRWVGTLGPRTNVVWKGEKLAVAALAERLRLKWRNALALRAVSLEVYAPRFGVLRLVVTRNRHQRPLGRPDDCRLAEAQPLERRDRLPRLEAVRGSGGLSVLGGSGDGSSRWPGTPDLRRAPDAASRH
jgi:hypothetical protein